MGRTPSNKKTCLVKSKQYNFRYKQILLKGMTLDKFNFDREYNDLTESKLGEKIIKKYYENYIPPGFKPKD